ncbi:hypothetical protein DH2020_005265 [Rehmannia glutinosa]|uniref:Uncharacterized protein n=1 Tax=Rehmannia glutinosa TaxID=99300 RepID=A0ABR0XG65_REHGL
MVVGVFVEHVDSRQDFKGNDEYIEGCGSHGDSVKSFYTEHVELVSDTDESEKQSFGDYSDCSEKLHDSDFDTDDNIFYQNIDMDVEWGALDIEQVNLIAQDLVPQKHAEHMVSKTQCNKAYPYVFNPEVDMDDPKFHIGLCFTSTDIFRKAIDKSNQEGLKRQLDEPPAGVEPLSSCKFSSKDDFRVNPITLDMRCNFIVDMDAKVEV